MKSEAKLRRLGVHHAIVDGHDCGQSIVVVNPDGTVADVHPLTHEEPFTEWIGGTITIVDGIIQ